MWYLRILEGRVSPEYEGPRMSLSLHPHRLPSSWSPRRRGLGVLSAPKATALLPQAPPAQLEAETVGNMSYVSWVPLLHISLLSGGSQKPNIETRSHLLPLRPSSLAVGKGLGWEEGVVNAARRKRKLAERGERSQRLSCPAPQVRSRPLPGGGDTQEP